jgi:hypothetical protein
MRYHDLHNLIVVENELGQQKDSFPMGNQKEAQARVDFLNKKESDYVKQLKADPLLQYDLHIDTRVGVAAQVFTTMLENKGPKDNLLDISRAAWHATDVFLSQRVWKE